jgi:hypothetical protein
MALFPLGQVVASPAAGRRLTETELSTVLRRHASGDWGDAPAELRANNADALRNNGPVFSVYNLGPDKVVMVQTAEDRTSSHVQIKGEDDATFMKLFGRKLLDWRYWLEIISSTL